MSIDIAIKAAQKAGDSLMSNFGNVVAKKKEGLEILTKADIEAERIIIETLSKTGYNILSEEAGFIDNGSEYCWIIDPLDGTTNFAYKKPTFCISIALTKGNDVLSAVIYDPYNKELFTAEKGNGAFRNDQKLEIGKESNVKNVIIGTDLGYKKREEILPYLHKLVNARYVRIIGSAAMSLADVAMGRAHAYYHNYIKPWDVSAGYLIIKEAGGVVTALDGSEWGTNCGSILAANPKLHAKLLEVFSK